MSVSRRTRPSLVDRASAHVVNNTAWGRAARVRLTALRARPYPLHWTSLFGVASIACVAVLFATGVYLMFFYVPSSAPVTYGGSGPLHGMRVSKAFDSTMGISFDVQGGLLVRQAHHWAALLLPATLIMQLLVSFFTGAFRKPRRTQWVLLFLIFIVALVGGWSGYALPDDMLSGTGLRIVEGIMLGIPVIGPWAVALLFGGEFPGQIIEHLYPIHVVIVPIALIGLLAVRGVMAFLQRPAQFPKPGRTEANVIGVPVLPNAVARMGGMAFAVAGLLFLIAGLFTISPIWDYGPSAPGDASAGSQPDWYTGFLDGALRLVPPGWEVVWLGRTWTFAVLVPLAVVGLFMLLVVVYPFVEHWIIGDQRDHHLLQRPRDTPTRTAIGVAGMTFYGVLWAAGSADVMAHQLALSFNQVITTYQIGLLVGPIVAFVIAKRVCLALQRKDRELLAHGHETGRIVRLPDGEYIEVHSPLTEEERWPLVNVERPLPIALRPDEAGRLTLARRVRAGLSRFYFANTLPGSPEARELTDGHDATSGVPGGSKPLSAGAETEEPLTRSGS